MTTMTLPGLRALNELTFRVRTTGITFSPLRRGSKLLSLRQLTTFEIAPFTSPFVAVYFNINRS